jgi:hypothetical protein
MPAAHLQGSVHLAGDFGRLGTQIVCVPNRLDLVQELAPPVGSLEVRMVKTFGRRQQPRTTTPIGTRSPSSGYPLIGAVV